MVAINHTGYLDFTFAGLPAVLQGQGRKVRFMAKKEIFDHKVGGPLMRKLRHISVDRANGGDSFDAAVQALKDGELVGVYPRQPSVEASNSGEFKSGAARMAIAADVPIVPHIVWGAQRIWTKDHPKKMWRPKVPISIAVGEPIQPTLPPTELTALLRSRMHHLLEQVQDAYGPYPEGEFWVPHRLGGGAPTFGPSRRIGDRRNDGQGRSAATSAWVEFARLAADGTRLPRDRDQCRGRGTRTGDHAHLPRLGEHSQARRGRGGDQPHQLHRFPARRPGGRQRRRRIRYMLKAEVQDVSVATI